MPTLYKFQQEDVDKLSKVSNALIGNDMGTGKTPTAIVLDQRRREATLSEKRLAWLAGGRKRTLVVTRKGLMGMWREHFAEWSPGLSVTVIDPKNRAAFVTAAIDGTHDVYICHWEALRLEPKLRTVRWLHVIGDEVQAVKSHKSKTAIAYKQIRALFLTDMSGTWADDSPLDGWSILNHLYPQRWSSYWNWEKDHIIYVWHGPGRQCCEKNHAPGTSYKEIIGFAGAETLQATMAPFYVKRRKEDVLPELPEKYSTTVHVDLLPVQQKAYDQMKHDMLAWVGEHEESPLAAPIVLSQLIRLEQFSNAYGEVIQVKRRVVCKDWTCPVWAESPAPHKHDKIVDTLKLTEPSSKLDALMDMLESSNEPEVVFARSKQLIYLLAARLEKAGISCELLTGDQSSPDYRTNMVDRFQRGEFRVFAGTIDAGGVGITLTRSSRVHMLGRHHNPSKNRQAIDRLHRIGQKNAVQVVDYVARGTLNAEALVKLAWKWSLLKEVLG